MRKTILATFLGLAALAAAACGNTGTTSSSDPGLETFPAVESLPAESMPAVESPSDMLESESPS